MSNLNFYEKPVALSKEGHKKTRIKALENNFKFARNTNSVILAGIEFTEAAKEYPIVFAKASGDGVDGGVSAGGAGVGVVPVALLGLRAEENLFISEDGDWCARYIPAFVRRYPFVIAETAEAGQRMVCIDESFSGFSKTEGDLLFEDDEPSPVLKQAINFLEEYQRQYVRTESFVKRLVDFDLLKTLNAKIDLDDGLQFGLTGLMVVDEQKLLQLSDDDALAFFKSGELAWVYCHLMSLSGMSLLLDKLISRTGAESKDGKAEKAEKAEKNSKTSKTSKTAKK